MVKGTRCYAAPVVDVLGSSSLKGQLILYDMQRKKEFQSSFLGHYY